MPADRSQYYKGARLTGGLCPGGVLPQQAATRLDELAEANRELTERLVEIRARIAELKGEHNR